MLQSSIRMPPPRYLDLRGWLRLGLVGLCALSASLAAESARADSQGESNPRAFTRLAQPEQRRGHVALLSGLAVAGGALAIGGYLLTTSDDLSTQRSGLYVAHAGLALSPLVSHAVVGEWGRGALFSIPPTVGAVGMTTLLQINPQTPTKSKHGTYIMYPLFTTLSIVGAAVGIFDAALVDERTPRLVLSAKLSTAFQGVGLRGAW